MTKSMAVQERVAETILDVAADLLAAGGKPPSMADVAAAAGVSRATLYRYFPTREQLLQALTSAGLNEAATRLAGADLDAVPVPEAIARIARVVAAAGSKYAAVADQGDPDGAVEQQIGSMIQAVLRRGIDDQTLRSDLTPGELGYLLGYLLRAAGRMAADHQAGAEKAAALITTVFLHGTQNHHAATSTADARGHTNP